jgi:hypothetical protein
MEILITREASVGDSMLIGSRTSPFVFSYCCIDTIICAIKLSIVLSFALDRVSHFALLSVLFLKKTTRVQIMKFLNVATSALLLSMAIVDAKVMRGSRRAAQKIRIPRGTKVCVDMLYARLNLSIDRVLTDSLTFLLLIRFYSIRTLTPLPSVC